MFAKTKQKIDRQVRKWYTDFGNEFVKEPLSKIRNELNTPVENTTAPQKDALLSRNDEAIFPVSYPPVFQKKEYHHYIEKYKLFQYHIDFFNELSSRIDLKGKTILEIGGSDIHRDIIFEKFGIKKYVCVDKPWQTHLETWKEHYASTPIYNFGEISLKDAIAKDDYVIFNGYGEDITDDFAGQFDLCISNCCLEHVVKLSEVFDKIYLSLKSGGKFYTRFGPIWSCAGGSHYWFTDDFNFNFRAPIPDFAHLTASYSDILELLKQKKPDLLSHENAAWQIKNGGAVLNRYFYEDYAYMLDHSKFQKSSIRSYWDLQPNKETREILEKHYPHNRRFEVWGTEICALKL